MAHWSWSLGPWRAGASAKPRWTSASGPQIDLGPATSRSLKLRLLDPSEASFTIDGFSPAAGYVEELITDLWVYRDGVAMLRGRAMAVRDQLNESGRYDLAVDVGDYRQVLERRLAYADRTWTTTEQSTIVWDAITDAQALAGGDFGLAKGTWPTTGVIRPSVTITAGDSVWSFIRNLSRMEGGFDFDISETLAASIYYPSRGTAAGAVLDYGGVVSETTRSFDPSRYANAVRQSGADGVAVVAAATPDIASAREGRWDAQFGDTQLATADMVARVAVTNLAQASMPLATYNLKLAKGRWGGPSHVWLGDYVTVVIKAGRLNERVTARVFELDIDLDATDQETVTVVVGDIRLDPRSVLRGIAKRLAVLARR